MLHSGMEINVRGVKRVVKSWEAHWSMKLKGLPHRLHILWEGETSYEKFESDSNGSFEDLEIVGS
jgi:hypothetical protein